MNKTERFLAALLLAGLLLQTGGVYQALPVVLIALLGLLVLYVVLLFPDWRKNTAAANRGRVASTLLLFGVLAGIGLQALGYHSFAYESVALFATGTVGALLSFFLTRNKKTGWHIIRLLAACAVLGLQLLVVVFFVYF